MKNTSLPRFAIRSAAFAAAVILSAVPLQAQKSSPSYLRDTPDEVQKADAQVSKVIERAETHFKQGELNLKDGKGEQARDEFDKAVDAVLESGLDVRAFPRLQKYYLELVERVYRAEIRDPFERLQQQRNAVVAAAPAGAEGQQAAGQEAADQQVAAVQVGFVDQKFEPSSLDVLSKLVLNDEEKNNVSAEKIAEAEDEIKNSLDFQFKPHPLVLQYINYYQGRGRATMETGLRRSGQFVPMAREIFRRHGIPEDIVWLGQVESAWRPTARSWAAASGLWQFIPSTGARFGLRQTAFVDERNSFEKATEASAKYLKWLYNRYGNWELAMAAYNTGEGNIDRAIARAGVADFWTIYPYIAQETRNYVPNILAVILIAKKPEKYGFREIQRMPRIDRQYDTISVPSSTSLHLLASLIDTNAELLQSINPELRRAVTPRGESYYVRVPAGKGRQAAELLKRVPQERRDQLAARVVMAAPGEDWQSVASRAGVPVAQLQQWNSNVDLSKGARLVVPAGIVRTARTFERRGETASGSSLRVVTAKGGETLAQLAAQYGAAVDDVARLNNLAAGAQLTRGQKVNVPTSAAPSAAPRRRR